MNNNNRNKKIAKNTIFLYIRMLFVMLISLFTVRVNLKNLGVENYGIYNTIGGIVVLFSFITNSCSAATSRYLNFALGEKNKEKARDVFSVSVIIHLFVSFIILLLSETIGLWLVNNYLVIPQEKLKVANIIYQFSVITTVLGITKIPYNAAVISHEKMSFYAVMSIFECIGRLVIAVLLNFAPFDVLIYYSLLIAIISLINLTIFKMYANKQFEVCNFWKPKDKSLYKELLSFSGWSLFSSIGTICSNQGLNIIMNHFFGVLANAAIGIANQVNNAIYQLISNFQVAFEPQITKSYASGEREYLIDLIFKTSKFSYYLLWFFVLPLGLNVNVVLKVWLTEVPQYSSIFLRLILIFSLIDAIIGPLWMVSYAIGNIKNYQIVAFSFSILLLPLAYIFFKFGFPPYIIVILRIGCNILFSLWRLGYLQKRMTFPIREYCIRVLFPCFIISIISCLISFFCFYFTRKNVIVQFFASCSVTVIINVLLMYCFGCNKNEKQLVLKILKRVFKKEK